MNKTVIKSYVLQPLALLAVPILLLLLGVDFLMVLAVEVLVLLCFACFKNINENIFFLFFLASFFIFLMSGDIAEAIFDRHYYLQFGEDATRHSRICILICLIFLYLGYIITSKKTYKFKLRSIDYDFNESLVYRIRLVSRFIYYCTYIVLIVNTLDVINFVRVYGYVEYYVSYDPILPTIIAEFADFTPIALCVFLATFPSKKECKYPLVTYSIYAVLSLFEGARGGFIYRAIFVLAYLIYRNYKDKGKEVWITKKTVVLLCLSVPFLLVFLFLYDYIRSGTEIVFSSFFDSLIDFFVNIGSSSKVIKYGYVYRERMDELRWFSLGGTLNYFKYGTLFNLFDLENIPATHTVEYALESHSFADYISYLSMETQYLNGQGAGSSFIAELYADFNYIGVAVGSAIYGILFKRFSILSEKHWLSTSIKLYMFMELISAPRAGFDSFISIILNVNFVLIMTAIYILACSLSRNKYKNVVVNIMGK